MGKIRAGVVGAGHLGYHHIRNYMALEGVSFVGAVDADPARCAKAADELGAPIFADINALVAAGVQAVSVATPTVSHPAVVQALLEAGVHVLVEKPIAPSVAEAEAMVATAGRMGRLLQVGHIERFNGAVMAFSKAIKRPRFIECHRLSPYPGRGHDVSVVLDLMIHDLDIVLSMVNSEVASVDAMGVAVFSDQEDIANVRIRFASGCVANLTSSRISVERMRKIRIFEQSAYISTDYSAQEVLVYRKKPGPVPEDVNPMAWITIEPLPVEKDEPLKLELASFIEAVRDGRRPLVDGGDGVRALKLAQRIIDFIREHT